MAAPEATAIAERYAELAAGLSDAVYLTGSATLDDWIAGVSDVDLVALTTGPPDRVALTGLHRAVRDALPDTVFDVLYLQAGDLAQAPDRVGARPFWNAGRLTEDPNLVCPVTWHSLADHGVPVGAAPALPETHRDDEALRDWCRANLADYWAGWARRGANPATRDGMALLTDWGVAWCVLGVLRLRYTIATAHVTSKSGAGRWGLQTFPEADRPLIAEALAARTALLAPPADRDAAAARREATVAFLRRAVAEHETR